MKILSFIILFSLSFSVNAAWKVDPSHSNINFLSTKKEHIVEIHRFERFIGTINNKGESELLIDLASVNTLIPIRDERMQKFLFKTSQFTQAKISNQIPVDKLNSLKVGELTQLNTKAVLKLHGKSVEIAMDLIIIKLNDGLAIQSAKPIVVDSRVFEMASGVDKLKELAGLPSISYTVPVTFSLKLVQK